MRIVFYSMNFMRTSSLGVSLSDSSEGLLPKRQGRGQGYIEVFPHKNQVVRTPKGYC